MKFSTEEYLLRVKKVQESMSEKGIDILFVSDPANICYLTGHNAWSFYVHQGAIVTLTDSMPIYFGRYMDAFSGVVQTTYLDDKHVTSYPDTYIHNPTCHPMEVLADVIMKLGGQDKNIGVEMDNYWFSAEAYETLKRKLPNSKLKNANLLVNWVRLIKSDTEIEFQKRAGKLSEIAMQAGLDSIGVGVRQCDVVASIHNAHLRGTDEFGGDYPAIVPLMPSGESAGAPHLTWTDERYTDNTVVAIELAGCYQKYHSPMARTVSIGKPDPKVIDVASIAIEGLETALATIKPGIYLEEIELAFRKVLQKHNLEKESRIGYSMGLNFPPDWGEHTASIRKGDKTILKPNMTFHCIPGMYFDNFGVSISESFYVTETGYETFGHFPRKLFIKN